ncbi:MAG TPA: oxidoreductase, partial [Tepidiformaceae bacterium]|nr:oxidoreductase [Tepidiformaceae bacterium]
MTYRAIVVEKQGEEFAVRLQELSEGDLPAGEVTIRVEWSSINYKDGLALTPNGRVIRSYPMVPGVDLAGTVTESADGRFAKGDAVMVTGYDVGVAHPGGFAEMARIPADWVMKVPPGTAGMTAGLSVEALEHNGLAPDQGTVIVTGSTGGVGSTAVSMLAQRGYTVAASTGKESEHAFLRELGASEILPREEVSAESGRPLEGERWAGAVDPVGGATTAYLIRTMKYGAGIALSGLTGGSAIGTTVFPFILRGVNLLGIDSVMCPMPKREHIWNRLGGDLKPRGLMESIAVETDLDGVREVCAQILAGKVKGRT